MIAGPSESTDSHVFQPCAWVEGYVVSWTCSCGARGWGGLGDGNWDKHLEDQDDG